MIYGWGLTLLFSLPIHFLSKYAMVDIVPFKGLLFNQKKTGPAEQVTAPPYDVISPQQQSALYEKNPLTWSV